MQQKIADDDSNGRWVRQPSIERAATFAIPFPDFDQGRVGMAVYKLNQDQTARIVEREVGE